jgi:hypothetical protein
LAQEAGNERVMIDSTIVRAHQHSVDALGHPTALSLTEGQDVKSSGDGDAASRGLGHRSSRTRRLYGTASQARGGHALRSV